MYNVYVKRIFVITEIVHMNAGVSSESRERKRLKSLSHSHEGWHPRSTPTSRAGSGASQNHFLKMVFQQQQKRVSSSSGDAREKRGSTLIF